VHISRLLPRCFVYTFDAAQLPFSRPMIGLAGAFGGGIAIRQQLEKVPLPKVVQSRPKDTEQTFKLMVCIVAASVPAFKKPGVVTSARPRVQLTLDQIQKSTELGDYVEPSGNVSWDQDCPWRFGDTLTFVATLKDVTGPGLKIKLNVHKDLNLGPLMFELDADTAIGEGCVDLRRMALPACVRQHKPRWGADTWESPPLLIPLSYVRGGAVTQGHGLGDAVAHVALVFGLDVDPELVLDACDSLDPRTARATDNSKSNWFGFGSESRTLVSRSLSDIGEFVFSDGASAKTESSKSREAPPPREGAHRPAQSELPPPSSSAMDTLTPAGVGAAIQRAVERGLKGEVNDTAGPLPDPEQSPEGWVSRKGPNGRLYWHHLALGPPPWEASPEPSQTVRNKQPQFVPNDYPTSYPSYPSHPFNDGQAQTSGGLAMLGMSLEAARGADGGAGGSFYSSPPTSGISGVNMPCAGLQRCQNTSFGPIQSDLPAEGWMSHRGQDGRMFWHHRSLGPAPWEHSRGHSYG